MKPMTTLTLSFILLLAFAAGAAVIASHVASLAAAGGMAAVDAHLARLSPWLLLLRIAIYSGIVGGWPCWTAAAAKLHRWNPAQTAFMKALRWRVAAWLLAYEAVFAQDGLARLLHFISD